MNTTIRAKARKSRLAKNRKPKQKRQKQNKRIAYTIRAGPRTIRGSGDYEVNPILNHALRGLGGLGSSYLGLGSDIGSNLADTAHRAFKAVTGYGEYKVKNNTLITDNGAPIFKPEDRVMHIRHREFVTDIYSGSLQSGASSFHSRVFFINPCFSNIFPWLSSIAKNFQQFRFKGLLISYESKSGNSVASSNTTLGTVIIATDYVVRSEQMRLGRPSFVNKQDMEAHEFSTSTVPSCNMLHPIECAPSEQVTLHSNTLVHALGPNDDVKFYVPCVVQVSTVGMQAAEINLGELWVSYDIELLKTRKDYTKTEYHGYFSGDIAGGFLPPVQTIKYQDPSFVVVDQANGEIIFNPAFYGPVKISFLIHSPGSTIVNVVNLTPASTSIVVENDFQDDAVDSVITGTASDQFRIANFYVTGGGQIDINGSYMGSDANGSVDLFIEAGRDDLNV